METCICWPMWQKDVSEYCKTFDRFKKANKSTSKRLRNMTKIQEPRIPWEIVHMDWVTGLPPGGGRRYNACLVIADRFMTEILSSPQHYGQIFTLFGTKLSFSTAYHPQSDGLAERMIQTLEDMVRKLCAYGLEFKDCDGFTHNWCTLLPALKLAYKKYIHASINQTAAILEKGWNPKLPQDSLRNDLAEIHPKAASFEGILEKTRKHAIRRKEDSFAYAKDKWDKSHATPDFKVGDLVLVSTTNFNKIKGLELSEELSNKHPTFPVSLIKPYKSSDAEKFPLRNKVHQVIPPIESSGLKKLTKVLKERNLRANKLREYLVRYSEPTCEDEWLTEKDIPEATKLLRRFKHTRNNNITK
ncbi:hypothetical protein O181_065288 [Austropuccinia psidii MF-1]|uniref:Integrase catalytic domain-containing protein n=1 Tax=Austropuccinia psidii MF-1 TaxID=1389203 RepID=A0A9Q3EPE7_9BASI|nr:hypothetical protein [Austropuccinia psidii MF-1]